MMLETPPQSPSTEGEANLGEQGEQKEWKQVNETKPIWKKSKTSIKEQEYKEFYQSVSMDFNAPLGHIHSSIE
jgi:molecular chaperone HtpG